MAEFLEASQDELHLRRPGLKIIELGAGCGWLGLTIARNLPSASVCITEMEEGGALEHLEYNVALNPMDNVSTAACDWALWQETAHKSDNATGGEGGAHTNPPGGGRNSADFKMISSTKWDLVIGSDLIYNDIGVLWLPRVLNDLIGQDGVAYYCHTKNRLPMADVDFILQLSSLGLACKETREKGAETPPPSPPFFESLFPEQRIQVLRIERAQSEEAAAYNRPLFAARDPSP
eukprot:Tamp_27197.p1 GENE.Tamp_27197~~Tamp_27197.p1  ORF type:complete len:270 (+),score=56.00 Tamp_27197:109-810(+)